MSSVFETFQNAMPRAAKRPRLDPFEENEASPPTVNTPPLHGMQVALARLQEQVGQGFAELCCGSLHSGSLSTIAQSSY